MDQSLSSDKTRSRRWTKETFAQKSARTNAIATRLARTYPELHVPLHHRNTFELLIAVILSAQCTDEAVNRVTPELFRRYPDPETLARASEADVELILHTLGLFRAKTKSLKKCARQLVQEFGGAVPATIKELTRLAGVGRKTANVILAHAFNVPGIIVDTHCRRLSRRLGLTRQQDPAKIELDLSRLLPAKEWTGLSHRLIIHGRRICHARKPVCDQCVLNDLCPSNEAGTEVQSSRFKARRKRRCRRD